METLRVHTLLARTDRCREREAEVYPLPAGKDARPGVVRMMQCCSKPHLAPEEESCGCKIALCFNCGCEFLEQPCHECAKEIQGDSV